MRTKKPIIRNKQTLVDNEEQYNAEQEYDVIVKTPASTSREKENTSMLSSCFAILKLCTVSLLRHNANTRYLFGCTVIPLEGNFNIPLKWYNYFTICAVPISVQSIFF